MIAFYTFKKGPKPNLATRRKLFWDVLMIAFIYILMIAFIDVLMTVFKFGTQFFAFFLKTINFCTETCCVILNQRLFAVRLVYSHVQICEKNFDLKIFVFHLSLYNGKTKSPISTRKKVLHTF